MKVCFHLTLRDIIEFVELRGDGYGGKSDFISGEIGGEDIIGTEVILLKVYIFETYGCNFS